MDNETTNTTQQPEPQPQRAGNLMIGPAEDRPKPGPTFEERLAEARRIMEQGGNPLEALVRRDPEPAPVAAAPDPAAAEPVAPTEPQTAAEPAAFEPPAGWARLDNGLYRGPDGRFYSEEQVRALAAGEQTPQSEEPTQTQEGQEAAPQPEEARAEPPEGELVTVSLPGRRPEDPDEVYEVPRALAESINRLRNGYMRREEFNRQMADVRAAREELQYVEQRLRHDPENFLIEHIPVERRANVVKHLLADEEVWNAVVEELARWDQNELERRAAWAELHAARMRQSREAEAAIAAERATAENALQIREVIRDLTPDSMDPQRADLFFRYAIRDLQQYVNEHGINRLDPAEVPILLHRLGTLQAFGIPLPTSPAPQANGRTIGGQTAAAQPSAVRPTVRPSGPAGSQVATAVPAQDPGAVFRQQVERRAAASAVAPMGVGAAPARPRPPDGQTVKDRIKWAREHFAR